ncbi:flagellar hook-basal body complex protein [Novosphingobium jiangmenense]|uniref:Flagellar hook protein FlgE n=1 Tax=Novosphingobium jiangmenense TaxID=2791981 RepID=A0ABS0HIZ1_9SPHN|nr:flagellar hook-basal body complex protein [Novosphingobium jiangmenense]MBF9151985.1 flagellar hook-basal body complex protein [Novosphingobium jiangmenense]
MSFYTSLNGLRNAQTDLGVISHNIANAETTGFKKSRTEFADIVVGSAFTNPKLVVGIGAAVESITQNFALGPIEQTGSALDLAINGDGFFTTRNVVTGQTLFTRNGSLTVDGGGHISDGSGNRLQVFPTDAAGTITSTTPADAVIPASNGTDAAGNPIEFAGITVGDDGAVTASYADGSNVIIGKVALASFIAPQGLKQVGSSNWVTTGISGAPTYGQPSTGQYGSLLSGALERSNVDIAEELVGLITAQRNFQANAKAIDTATQISQTVIQLQT